MNRLVRQCVIAFVASAFACGAAQAQLFRAYLSFNGNDANPCTVTAPCRLLPAALNAVADGGEVWILDSANYNAGTVNIAKNVSILTVPGAVGSIVAFGGGPAITITTAVFVKLHNIVISNNATNPGTDGIQVSGGGSLTVESSVISVALDGIVVTGALSG